MPALADGLLRVQAQGGRGLPGGVQPGDGLVEVGAGPAVEPGGVDQFGQQVPEQVIGRYGDLAAGAGQGGLGGERAAGLPGPGGGVFDFGELRVAEPEADGVPARGGLAGPARAGRGRPGRWRSSRMRKSAPHSVLSPPSRRVLPQRFPDRMSPAAAFSMHHGPRPVQTQRNVKDNSLRSLSGIPPGSWNSTGWCCIEHEIGRGSLPGAPGHAGGPRRPRLIAAGSCGGGSADCAGKTGCRVPGIDAAAGFCPGRSGVQGNAPARGFCLMGPLSWISGPLSIRSGAV